MNKEDLRKKMKQRLNHQTKVERRRKSKIIQENLFRQKEFSSSKCVMLYVSKGTAEVQTGPIIKKALEMGKKVVLPVTLVREKRMLPVRLNSMRQGLKKGPYGVYEPKGYDPERPVSAKEIDLVVVPGVAFDRKNNRLGHGQGYYDRFLKLLPRRTSRIGLGFRFQLLEDIPTIGTDVSLTRVITN